MKITRVFNGADGLSRFGEVDVELADSGPIGSLSKCYPVEGVYFRETPGDYHFDWHPAPQRQFIVLLDGEIAIETGDGDRRTFKGGEILLVEDTTGRGHLTYSVDGKLRRSLFLPLADTTNL